MKILRLVLLAIGVLALVLGAMWLSGGTTPPPPVNPQKTILAETSKTIHASWAEAETWSQKLFAEQQSDIGQMQGAGRISPTEADYLMAQSNNAAADALHREGAVAVAHNVGDDDVAGIERAVVERLVFIGDFYREFADGGDVIVYLVHLEVVRHGAGPFKDKREDYHQQTK